uniref:Transposase n=1 Tax=Bursaphelenchus xylophilus TaxID=6326 RepID=A0A1I7SGN8_BURXY
MKAPRPPEIREAGRPQANQGMAYIVLPDIPKDVQTLEAHTLKKRPP